MKIAEDILTRVDFWIYLTMAVIFMIGVFICLIPVKKIEKCLGKAEKMLGERRSDGSYLYNSPDFLKCKELNDCWRRFLSNLELMRKNNGVCEVYDFINLQTAIHGRWLL